ncbi:hypothetical protein [Corynebacterium sp.]|uniref:hypothetical protein n=1 Tax=Corynebacterium sp. TaxID=1720 RepID=UPI0026DAC3AA|nr:hypothetical protein [Corynebacterium sp.]MDO5031056.1 hypothetical protein [Corynebacterium sp.]
MNKTFPALLLCAFAVSGCSILQPQDTGLNNNIVVSSSEVPSFEPQKVKEKEVSTDLSAPVKDPGLNVEFELQSLYSDSVAGTVVTIKVHNLNEVPLPVDAIEDPVLERADGNGGWAKVDMLPYDPEVNTNVAAPGLDYPLGAGASTNLQYRFDTAPGNLWNARLHIGNIVYVGALNL